MFKFKPREVLEGPDTGRFFCMYKTTRDSNPKKYYMIHSAFSEEEAINQGLEFSKQHKLEKVSTQRI